MIGLVIDQKGLEKIVEHLIERKRRKMFNNSMRAAINHWHFKILPKHFGLLQYALYPDAFLKKKKEGQSMVKTGAFKSRILGNPIIKATHKNASVKYNFGRPAHSLNKLNSFYKDIYSDIKTMPEKTKHRIFGYMRGKKITFEKAKKEIIEKTSRRNSYSARTQKIFRRGITAVNRADIEEIKIFIRNFIIDELNGNTKFNTAVKIA